MFWCGHHDVPVQHETVLQAEGCWNREGLEKIHREFIPALLVENGVDIVEGLREFEFQAWLQMWAPEDVQRELISYLEHEAWVLDGETREMDERDLYYWRSM